MDGPVNHDDQVGLEDPFTTFLLKLCADALEAGRFSDSVHHSRTLLDLRSKSRPAFLLLVDCLTAVMSSGLNPPSGHDSGYSVTWHDVHLMTSYYQGALQE